MPLLKLFSKTEAPVATISYLPSGAFIINRAGNIFASTLPSAFSKEIQEQIGKTALQSFAYCKKNNLSLSELVVSYAGFKIVSRELRGGALIFLQPERVSKITITLPEMRNPTLDDFILYLETYIECFKQFNGYLNLAKMRTFTADDEGQFLEIKSLIIQGFEVIQTAVEQGAPRKDEIVSLIASSPTLRHLAENEQAENLAEATWNKCFLTLQSLLGRLKVQQQRAEGDWSWTTLFKQK
jgi:hypothetical protein